MALTLTTSRSPVDQDYGEFPFWDDVEEGEGEQLNWYVLLLLVFVLAGVTGNVLVCVAIAAEKKLQNVTNYFLMSLALADLLVSVVVMPCAIVNELMGNSCTFIYYQLCTIELYA